MADSVTIVGGGLAGLAAAAALSQQGVACTVFESRSRLGGRASSFPDATTTEWVDNCQHVSMGCCTNFAHFCRLTGIADAFEPQRELYFVGPKGRIHPFRAQGWPAPLHLAGAFAGLSYLSWKQKWQLGWALRSLVQEQPAVDDRRTFLDWLREHGQPPAVIDRFWHVVIVSALSETLDRVAIAPARKVFVDGFLRHPQAWQVLIPQRPWEELYAGPLTAALTQRGVQIRRLTAVERLERTGQRITSLVLKSGEVEPVHELIVAVPFYRLRSLLPDDLGDQPPFNGAEQLSTAPISSVHLWFDRAVIPLPHAVFVEGLVQWVFCCTPRTSAQQDSATPAESATSTAAATGASNGAPPGIPNSEPRSSHYYQVVISASRDVLGRPSEQVCQQVVDELASVWPEVRSARLLHSRQVTEHRAVFSVLPGSDRFRAPQQSPIENLQLAGDWTQTGWPATMEGAVRSGFLAAENLLRRRGRPVQIMQPDLPISWLSRWLYRWPAADIGTPRSSSK
jgi:squalene-associated FAD-dependent desaturase